MSANPYAPPGSRVEDAAERGVAPPMWNPTAAVNWSVFFTPVFGSFLQMRNWAALDEPARENTAKLWFIVSVILVVISIGMSFTTQGPKANALGFGYLLIWYFAAARSQIKYVKERFGSEYPRKRWGGPIGIALLVMIGAMVLTTILAGTGGANR